MSDEGFVQILASGWMTEDEVRTGAQLAATEAGGVLTDDPGLRFTHGDGSLEALHLREGQAVWRFKMRRRP